MAQGNATMPVKVAEDDFEVGTKVGAKLAKVLRLRRDPEDKTRWLTEWGNKTDLGLYRTVKRIMEEK